MVNNTFQKYYSLSEVSKILGVCKDTLRNWDRKGKLVAHRHPMNHRLFYTSNQLKIFEEWHLDNYEFDNVKVKTSTFQSIELFAGAGGMALGLEKSGFKPLMLNEFDQFAVETLKANRPNWNIILNDIMNVCFKSYKNKVDLLSGGFPCQPFSSAGLGNGFKDDRGCLVFEFARAVNECKPKSILLENVKGLKTHDNGKTLNKILNTLIDLGYVFDKPKIIKAMYYNVPQKRERLILIGIRSDIYKEGLFDYKIPISPKRIMRDALKKGILYDCEVPKSIGQIYSKRKKQIMAMVPPGGCHRDLPDNIQKEYMKKSYYLSGGRTGMARRLSWDEPCLTLLCSPSQNQTERCHPSETRPLEVREYARIQTFPDDWIFKGSMNNQYKQIGNAVPVNLAYALGNVMIQILSKLN